MAAEREAARVVFLLGQGLAKEDGAERFAPIVEAGERFLLVLNAQYERDVAEHDASIEAYTAAEAEVSMLKAMLDAPDEDEGAEQ
jgi:hypothetical protein